MTSGALSFRVDQRAIEEFKRFGALQRYKPGMLDAYIFWDERILNKGLPEDWEDRGTVSVVRGTARTDWKLYLETQSQIRMGFVKSRDGSTVRLAMLMPADQMTHREALTELRKRT